MLVVATTPRQLVRQAGERVKCDQGSTVAGVTRLIARAGSAAPDGGVRLPSRVLNFGSLAYIADYYGELHPFKEAKPMDNESLVSSPPSGHMGADLEVLA
jgi:hypothetical protein